MLDVGRRPAVVPDAAELELALHVGVVGDGRFRLARGKGVRVGGGEAGRLRVGHVAPHGADLRPVPGPQHEVEEVVDGLRVLLGARRVVGDVARHRPQQVALLGRGIDAVRALLVGDDHHRLPAVEHDDLLVEQQVDRLLEARPEHPELAGLLLLDEVVDDRVDLVLGHVHGVADVRDPRVLHVDRRLVAGGGVVVLERHVARVLRIEQRAEGIDRAHAAGLVRQVADRFALQDGRDAVDLPLVGDVRPAGRAVHEVLRDVLVRAPVGHPAGIDRQDQAKLRQRLLHAADDVQRVVGRRAAAAEQDVDDRRRRVADGDQVHVPARLVGVARPVAGRIAHADIRERHRARGRERLGPRRAGQRKADCAETAQAAGLQKRPPCEIELAHELPPLSDRRVEAPPGAPASLAAMIGPRTKGVDCPEET